MILRSILAVTDSWAELGQVALSGVAYIAMSTGMIAFNKYLMHEGRFPYATAMTAIQMAFCTVLSLVLYAVKPSLFPSLAAADTVKQGLHRRQMLLRAAVPIAALYGFQLALSNTAYLHSSVAFLQMMKESNVVWCYIFSVLVALEKFSWLKVGVIAMIMFATMLTVEGELKFSWQGFATQASSQIFESWKIVLQALLLTSTGFRLDPLSYVLVVTPLCFITIVTIMAFLLVHPTDLLALPSRGTLFEWWPLLFANALLAFGLNVVIAVFVQMTSGMSFVLSGILKDTTIVLSSVLLFGSPLSGVQAVGFTLQLGLIFAWSRNAAQQQQQQQQLADSMELPGAKSSSSSSSVSAKGRLFRQSCHRSSAADGYGTVNRDEEVSY
mmetsp:Transcript_11121/g.25494  ORF Transcript_11121/g.25494 Transcript_11121/m.25494 type:complete len:383 (-) Transcript_11121:141-1289(-)|eukprot:CAMPEP_0178417282 /NCGR_PEP_ID=MMETSP0689_2-20121128/24494_1 /TAXON_ID=160604 /ORGANISM="Amphidinium massartii, Strain CS-259" /LENGTH=382 /DNA_ID=CAMNT_0020038643 /DNA_START=83 /DNA_END=1231 /DNA_ORIENTATION=+